MKSLLPTGVPIRKPEIPAEGRRSAETHGCTDICRQQYAFDRNQDCRQRRTLLPPSKPRCRDSAVNRINCRPSASSSAIRINKPAVSARMSKNCAALAGRNHFRGQPHPASSMPVHRTGIMVFPDNLGPGTLETLLEDCAATHYPPTAGTGPQLHDGWRWSPRRIERRNLEKRRQPAESHDCGDRRIAAAGCIDRCHAAPGSLADGQRSRSRASLALHCAHLKDLLDLP